MFRLVEMRLVQWHGYQDEVCHLENSTLITGQNGVGKTTLLDAIQYALVADQTMVRFNKANENSRRTLVGYCRWRTNAEDQGGRGKGSFLRGASTSYVALRFAHDDDRSRDFVCGVVLEAGDGESLLSQHHFVVPEVGVADLPFVKGEKPLSSADFREAMRRLGWKTIPDATTYRLNLRHRLGYLPEAFCHLLVKALDFKPIGSVRQFIMDFLLEERPLETEALLRNVENYQRLEQEADAAKQRIAGLHTILDMHSQLERAKDELAIMEYMVRRSQVDLAEEKVLEIDAEREKKETERQEASQAAAFHTQREEALKQDLELVIGSLSGVPAYQQHERLGADLERARESVSEAEQATQEAGRLQSSMRLLLQSLTSPGVGHFRSVEPDLFTDDPFAVEERLQKAREFLDSQGAPDGRRARSWRSMLEDATRVYTLAQADAGRKIVGLHTRGQELRAEQEGLTTGRVTYRREVQALLHLLNSRLDLEEEIRPLCEQIEVRDPVWADAAEAMLGEMRFALPVPEEHYERAVMLYQKHKNGYSLPGAGPVALHGVRIIDLRGVFRDITGGRGSNRGALAEQIEARNDLARACIGYFLGDVMCVRQAVDLRTQRRAVTPDVMVHQRHTTYRISPEVYARRYIGQASRAYRSEQITQELLWIQKEIDRLQPIVAFARETVQHCSEAFGQLDRYLEYAKTASDLEARTRRVEDLLRQITLLEADPEVRRLVEEKEWLDAAIDEHRSLTNENLSLAGNLAGEIRRAGQQRDEALQAAEAAKSRLVEWGVGVEPGRITGYSQRYAERREKDGLSPREIETEYERQRKNREGQVSGRRDELVKLQVGFENTFHLPTPEDPEDILRYAEDSAKWEESRLPEYRQRIAAVREEARRQLAEDYLYRLYDSVRLMEERFKDMNRALASEAANVRWGRYRFTVAPLTKHKALYDLVMSVGQTGKDSLFNAEAVRTWEAEELDQLADSLLHTRTETVEETVLRDYREFFDYDLILRRTDGKEEYFKNVTGAGSGGENQVPYYIAIFSAMYQMYRQTSRDGQPTCGLVLLDEAFAKMDEQRIESVLGLARHFGLQLVMVTPGDKVATIVPRVETTLLVQRDQSVSDSVPLIRRFNKEMLQDVLGEFEGCEPAAPTSA